jgi:hypothetical protein
LNLYRSNKNKSVLKDKLVNGIWGIGYRSRLKLKAQTILTTRQLRETDNRFIEGF